VRAAHLLLREAGEPPLESYLSHDPCHDHDQPYLNETKENRKGKTSKYFVENGETKHKRRMIKMQNNSRSNQNSKDREELSENQTTRERGTSNSLL
jgi:hypothetical protein